MCRSYKINCASLAVISYGNANASFISEPYPGNIVVLTFPSHYNDCLTEDAQVTLLSSEMTLSCHIGFSLILGLKLGKLPC